MSFLSNFSHWLVNVLEPYGAAGLMIIAIGDSSFLSLPEVNDAALMALSISNPSRMWILATMTVLGSVIGCSLLYLVGRRGGEALLRRKFAEHRVARIKDWYQRYGMLAVIVPSLLPPPLPFKIFVLSAGAFQISWFRFIAAVAIGRSIRYFTEGLLAVWYGQRALQIVAENFAGFGVGLAVVIVVGAFVYTYGRRRRVSPKLLILPFLLVALTTGCVKNRTVPPGERMLPSFPFNRQDALEKLERISGSIQTVQSSIRLEGSTASKTEDFKRPTAPTMSGILIMKRPMGIFLKASLSLFSVFEMVSDGDRYQVYVTSSKELYEGTEDAPPSKQFSHLKDIENQFVNIRPRQLQEALMIDVHPLLENPSIRVSGHEFPLVQDRRTYYLVEFLDDSAPGVSKVVSVLWFDLSTANVDLVRRQTYEADGKLSTDTSYEGYESFGLTLRYPTHIEVRFAETDTLIKLDLDPKQVVLNGDVSEEALELKDHPGAKVYHFEPRAMVSQQ